MRALFHTSASCLALAAAVFAGGEAKSAVPIDDSDDTAVLAEKPPASQPESLPDQPESQSEDPTEQPVQQPEGPLAIPDCPRYPPQHCAINHHTVSQSQ